MTAHEHEPAVHPIELFSDLVFVVALNITARLFEESAEFWHGLWLYALRIFLLTGVLYQTMVGVPTFIALFGGGIQPRHFVGMFVWMGAILFMVRAFESGEHRVGVAWFCLAYTLAAGMTCREVTRPKPPEMSEEVYSFFQMLARVLVPFVTPTILVLPVIAGSYFMEVGGRVRTSRAAATASARGGGHYVPYAPLICPRAPFASARSTPGRPSRTHDRASPLVVTSRAHRPAEARRALVGC